MGSSAEGWLKRYQAGQHAAVWSEIVALGARVREPGSLLEAHRVATELMLRVRRSLEALQSRWEQAGFEFGYSWAGNQEEARLAPPRLGKPLKTTLTSLDRFEQHRGPLPLALRAFYEVVGAVNFVGRMPPDWPGEESLDPLQLEAFPPQLEALLGGATELTLFPDHLHKYFISGVGSVYALVPDLSADPVLQFEGGPIKLKKKELRLVDYLREVILRGGGMGARFIGQEVEPGLLQELTADLEPF